MTHECVMVAAGGAFLIDGEPVPAWLRELADAARMMEVSPRLRPPASGGRRSAVLVLFAAGPAGPDHPDLLFIQRSAGLRRHAGQPAFPGGVIDPVDAGPVAAALREAAEEVGVDPGGVEVIATLPELFIPPTGFLVVPVLAWWRRPSAVAPVDPAEVAAVERISVSELADPPARLMIHRPRGIILPAFRVRGLLIWGMTAAVVDRLLALAGWERPWDSATVVDWPELAGGNTTTAGRRIPGELFPARRYRFCLACPPAALGCLPGAGIPGLIGLVTGTRETM